MNQRRVLKLFNFANAEWIDGKNEQPNVPDGKLEFNALKDMKTAEVRAQWKTIMAKIPESIFYQKYFSFKC